MSLQFMIGRSGSGKTTAIYENLIAQSLACPQKDFFFIVPEQYTLQTQKDIVVKHPEHGTMNIDIVSFPRLAYRIFEELSYAPKQILEDMGKRMILRRILEDKKEALHVFGTSVKKPGFVEEMKSMISEFYQYQVPMDQLRTLDTKNQAKLGLKLQDLILVREEFQKFLDRDVIVAEQLLEILAQKVPESSKLKDSVIYIDGFTGFTPVQNQLLGVLLKYAEKVIISVTADPGIEKIPYMNPHALFGLSNRMTMTLKNMCDEAGIVIEPPVYFGEPGKPPVRLMEKPDLAALEEGLFRIKHKVVYDKEVSNVTLFSGRDCHEEVRAIGEKIAYYVREEGMRYRDIAVIAGDVEQYASHFEQCFGELDMPYFIDHKKSILNNPCVETIRGLYQLTEENFSYHSVFRYLKAGMTSLSPEEVDCLENYALAMGISNKKRWTESFTRLLYGQTESDLAKLNLLREQFLDEVLCFYEASKQKGQNVRAHMTALYEFLRLINAEEDLNAYADAFAEEGNFTMEKTYRQIYPYIIGLMDKMVEILGEEEMDVKEVRSIVETGLEELKIGVIPPGIDQIVVGDLIRTRLKDIKVLFIAGMNEGNIPKAAADSGILSDYEREYLQEKGVALSENAIQAAYTEQFYLYLATSKPTKHLYLSYANVSDEGKSLRPSYFLGRITGILTKLVEEQAHPAGHFTKAYSKHTFIEGLRGHEEGVEVPDWKEIGSLILGREFLEWYLSACCYENREDNLSEEAAKIVYGEVLRNSVSRLERFGACAYAHFLQYGLHLRARQEYKLMTTDLGNIFHRSLEIISKKIQTTYDSWKDIDKEEQKLLTNDAVDASINEWNGELLNESHRNHYIIDIVKRMTKRTLWAVLKQLENSDFKPYAFEIEFKSYKDLDAAKLELHQGTRMYLEGKVDRVDRFEDEENVYLKVIDYKSGMKKFDLSELYHGLQLQLVIYMNAMMEIEGRKTDKNMIPAGLFYYRLDDPMVERKEGTSSEEEILKELKLNGYTNRDYHIPDHMEQDVKDFISIEVSKLKSGAYGKRSKLLSTEEFALMQEYAAAKMTEAGNKMMHGDISIAPYRKDSKSDSTPCGYCDYRAVCHFDPRLDSYREITTLKPETILEIWKGEDADGLDETTTAGN